MSPDELQKIDTEYHTCKKCHTELELSKRVPFGCDPKTKEHKHTCPKCNYTWSHKNPRLENAGLL